MKAVKWNTDTASAETLPVCALTLALFCFYSMCSIAPCFQNTQVGLCLFGVLSGDHPGLTFNGNCSFQGHRVSEKEHSVNRKADEEIRYPVMQGKWRR